MRCRNNILPFCAHLVMTRETGCEQRDPLSTFLGTLGFVCNEVYFKITKLQPLLLLLLLLFLKTGSHEFSFLHMFPLRVVAPGPTALWQVTHWEHPPPAPLHVSFSALCALLCLAPPFMIKVLTMICTGGGGRMCVLWIQNAFLLTIAMLLGSRGTILIFFLIQWNYSVALKTVFFFFCIKFTVKICNMVKGLFLLPYHF